jgi:hypothetical protein
MPTKYTRRPFAMGNTANPVVVTPELRGSLMKDSSGEFPALAGLFSELAIETEEPTTSGGVSAVFSTATTMTQVLADINGTAGLSGFVTAEEVEGCLVLKSTGNGEGSYVRIMPPVSGFDDASAVFGFEVYPHPLATSSAGDLLDAPTRPRQQINPVGTKFIATGEDRVGSAYNRALQMLSLNADTLYTWLQRSVARPVRIEVDATTHAAYLSTNADGSIDQVDLSALSAFDASLGDVRLCVGGAAGLSRNSTLAEIADLYEVTDVELKEIPAQDRTVRIGAVTRGQRTAVLPTFVDDASVPTTPVPNTLLTTADGGNALGVDRAKHASVTITEVRQRTAIVCTGATFVTSGVTAGDVATISGAAVDSPFNHDGTYLVEMVVSEEELILRPTDTSETVRELNPAAGGFGSVVISSGGEWERTIWLSFYPPIPRMPEGGKLVLTIPVETALGSLALADLVNGSTRTGNNVDGWALLNLWKGLNLDGVYQGMGAARGSGFFGAITHRPLRMDRAATGTKAQGSLERASTGSAVFDTHTLRLQAAAADRFDRDDVGRTILLTAGPFLADEPWTVVRLIDSATVELAPPLHRAGYQSADGITVTVTAWKLLDGDVIDIHGMMHLVSPEYFGEGDDAPAEGGYLYSREQRDQGTTDPPVPGLFSFLHLERIRLITAGTNVTITTSAPISADDVLPLSFAPEGSSNIYGETYETKTGVAQSSLTFVRILNGKNAGLYRVKGVKDTSVSSNAVTVQHLDGTPVVFTAEAEAQVAFYNAKIGMSVPTLGGPGTANTRSAAMSLFEDAYETGVDAGHALRLGWRGAGGGTYGYLNDPEYKAYDNGDAAEGYFTEFYGYAPAGGFYYEVHGAASGVNARRTARGGVIVSDSHELDMSLAAAPNDYSKSNSTAYNHGWGLRLQNEGHDPGLLITRSTTRGLADTFGYPAAAAIVVRYDGPVSGIWSGMDATGSIYVRSTPTTQNKEAGIFSESGLGAALWVRPFYPIGLTLPDELFGTSFDYDGATNFVTELGSAGQMLPISAADPALLADTDAPDFTKFRLPHHGVVILSPADAPTFATALVKYIGQVLEVAGSATRDGQYLIVAMDHDTDLDIVYFAVEDTSVVSTAWVGTEAATSIRVLAKRWHRAHVDIAEWMQIGTQLASSRYEAPTLTLGPLVENAVSRAPQFVGPFSPQLDTEGASSAVLLYPNADGEGVGLRVDIGTMPGLDETYAAFTAEWDDGIFKSGWTMETEQPRSPFANVGILAAGATLSGFSSRVLTATNCGSLVVDDVALEVVTQNTANGPIISFSTYYGGCLGVGSHPDNWGGPDDEDTARVWLRGTRGLPTTNYALRGTVLVSLPSGDTRTLVLALRTDDGTVLASHNTNIVSDGTPQEVTYDFTEYTLSHAAYDALTSSMLETQGVHLTLDIPEIGGASVADVTRVLAMRLEQISRPSRLVGHQEVLGAVRATAFRHISPVRGFQTLSPFSAELLNPVDFAKCMGHQTSYGFSRSYGQLEGHGVGLVSDGSDWYMPTFNYASFFKKGPHSAAIVAYHPYFDPLWYAQSVDTTNVGASYSLNYPDVDQFVMPGRTGFLLALDPPHGSRLTSLHYSLSFRPSFRLSELGVMTAAWNVYRDLPFDLTEVRQNMSDWYSVANWNAKAGVMVRLWRTNTLDFGADMEALYPGNKAADAGYAELICEGEVDISAETPPSFTENPADASAQTGQNDGLSDEYFHRGVLNLHGALFDSNHADVVDRRHYSYFMTVEFYAGPRQLLDDAAALFGTGSTEIWWYPDDEFTEKQHVIVDAVTVGGSPHVANSRHGFSGLQVGYPLHNTADQLPPIVKLRGARLGWTTDRAGDKGWG